MMVRILQGDCRAVLRSLPDQSVHTCVTSPPYFGLRSYGIGTENGEIGLEPTPDAFVAELVGVFREVRRVLRDDGTCWLNLGDSYNAQPGQRKTTDKVGAKQETNAGSNSIGSRSVDGLKPKDLIGIPWRVAFALQADGWYLRQDIIWSKPNPMPESVTDRCTKSHEYIFMLSKSPKYYYDAAAIAEPLAYGSVERSQRGRSNHHKWADGGPGNQTIAKVPPSSGRPVNGYSEPYNGQSTKDYAAGGAQDASATKKRIVDRILSGELKTRNKRSVWTVTTKPYKGAHFATFPPDLIEPCILAGAPVDGWVLDPFGGSGTTGMVANRSRRNCILIDLGRGYVEMAKQRIEKDAGLLAQVSIG